MMTREALDALRIGDLVIVRGMGADRSGAGVYRITDASKAKVKTAVGEFSRKTGKRVGAQTWDAWELSPATPERVTAVRAQNERSRLLAHIREQISSRNDRFSTDQLQRIFTIMQEGAS